MADYLNDVYAEMMRICQQQKERPLTPQEKEIVKQANSSLRTIYGNLDKTIIKMKQMISFLEQSTTFRGVTKNLHLALKEKEDELTLIEGILRSFQGIIAQR